jgi:hypothetical protein
VLHTAAVVEQPRGEQLYVLSTSYAYVQSCAEAESCQAPPVTDKSEDATYKAGLDKQGLVILLLMLVDVTGLSKNLYEKAIW